MDKAKMIPFSPPHILSSTLSHEEGDNERQSAYGGGEGGPPMSPERMTRLEGRMDRLENKVDQIHRQIWGACLTTILGVIAAIIAFGQWQTSWLQDSVTQTRQNLEKNSDRNWEAAQKSLDKIEAIQLRLERMDAQRDTEAPK